MLADEVIKNLAEIIRTDESDLCDRTFKQTTKIALQLKFIFRKKSLKLGEEKDVELSVKMNYNALMKESFRVPVSF